MKTDKEIMELIGLGKPKKSYSKESKDAHILLNKHMIKIFKVGYKYGLMANATDRLKEIGEYIKQ